MQIPANACQCPTCAGMQCALQGNQGRVDGTHAVQPVP